MKKTPNACDGCVAGGGRTAPRGGCACCRNTVGRRRFLAAAGASAAGIQMGVLDFAASVMAGQAPMPSKPLIRAALVRPKDQKGYWMTFTGPGYDAPARMAEFTRIMSDAARQLDVRLEIHPDPVCDPRDYKGFHQLFLLGKWDRMLKAYGQLAGIEVVPI